MYIGTLSQNSIRKNELRLDSLMELACRPVCHLSHELPLLLQALGSWFSRCITELQTWKGERHWEMLSEVKET